MPPSSRKSASAGAVPERLDPGEQDTERTVTRMADMLADALIRRLNQSRPQPDPVAVGGLNPRLVRDYQVTRQTLAGPDDDEADVVGTGIIVGVVPRKAAVGDRVLVQLTRSAQPQRVFFTGADGGIVEAAPFEPVEDGYDDARYLGGSYYDLTVEVPDGAVTGPITITTDDQPLTSIFPVEIEPPKGAGR